MGRKIIVLKFGGTSVSSYKNWRHIMNIINKHVQLFKVVIVISALTGITDKLVSISSTNTSTEIKEKLVREINEQHLLLAADCGVEVSDSIRIGCDDITELYKKINCDYDPLIASNIIAYGELLSTRLGIAVLNKMYANCSLIDTRDIIRVNYDKTKTLYFNFLDAEINYNQLKDVSFEQDIVLMPGFICSKMYNGKYRTCLMGRGGSDTCGSLIAYMTNAELYEIYTDVDGVYDSDPNKNDNAVLKIKLTYDEAYNLALGGAKILHHKCISPLKAKRILCIVKNVNESKCHTTIYF